MKISEDTMHYKCEYCGKEYSRTDADHNCLWVLRLDGEPLPVCGGCNITMKEESDEERIDA